MRSSRLALAVLTLVAVTAWSSTAHATHFRGAYISWKSLGGNTVRFRTVQLFDSSEINPLPINPGVDDSVISAPYAVIFSANDLAGQSYTMIEYSVDYTYPNALTHTAFLSFDDQQVNCCRLDPGLVNVPDGDYRVATVVDFNAGANTQSPVTKIPMILRLKDDPRCNNSINLSGKISDDGAFTCATATDGSGLGDAGPLSGTGITHGGAISVSAGCVLSMNTTGTSVGDKFATQVKINEATGATMQVDLLIEIEDGLCPVCGDNMAEGSEKCDGTDAAACFGGGFCQPPGGMNECTCCGDGIENDSEFCDGTDGIEDCEIGCSPTCLCTSPGGGSESGCTGPSCADSEPTCTGAAGPFTLEVGQSFATVFPVDSIFTGFSVCEDLTVNEAPWGSLPSGGSVSPTFQAAPTSGTCSHDGTTVCDGNEDCQLCSHDNTTLCTSDTDCSVLSPGSTCQCGVSSCVIPNNTLQTTFDWTPLPTQDAQTYLVKVTFTDPDFTVPGSLDYVCGFNIRVPGCGDDIVDTGEDCDGTADGACPGHCRPPGDANECTCAVCGDAILDGGEQCDAAPADGACPGACLPSCICAICGDNDANAPGEECDGSDDGACVVPGACYPPSDPDGCTCAKCGDNRVHPGIGEECDGTSDLACPGDCRPPLDPDECKCAVCGDDRLDPGEQCDGTSDLACPGDCRPAGDVAECQCAICGDNRIDAGEQCDGTGGGIFGPCPGECQSPLSANPCECPVCGDGDVNAPGEVCDGADDAACPGACLLNCTCGTCGDNDVNAPGEQCDGTDAAACPGQCLPDGNANECKCPICGDGDINQGSEQCDGADDAACSGLCRPNCVCAICGDNVTDAPTEQCDGTSDAACVGQCLPPGNQNQCQCPVCGDDDVNQGSEQCDGTDDSACPGHCSGTCTCTTCGDNDAEAPVEGCDGTDDGACPGACRPPGDLNECDCPVCGDDDVNQLSEVCDGPDAGACPGGFCASTCQCAVCGDGETNGTEECDGTDASECSSVCLAGCICAVCGDGDINQPGEQCDPPASEVCNNLSDDDGDNLIDCADTDCPTVCMRTDNTTFPPPNVTKCTKHKDCRIVDPTSSCVGIGNCGATCELVFGCEPIGPDPSVIEFIEPGPDLFRMHALFTPRTVLHPAEEGLTLLLSNVDGVIYSAELLAGDLQEVGKGGTRFRFKDRAAKTGSGNRNGLYRVSMRYKRINGAAVWSFKIQAYADLSTATHALMNTQVQIGNDGTAVQAEWTATNTGWHLSPGDLR